MSFQALSSPCDFFCYSLSMRLSFGEWLDDRLRERGWSQVAFAETVGVARQTVGTWVNNVKPPRRRAARDIAKVLGIETNEVLVRAGYPPMDPDYVLPEDRLPEPEIDLADPLLSFFTAHAGELSPEEKRAIIEVARVILSKQS